MKKSIVFPLAAIVLLASCEREIAAPEVVVNPDSESFSLCVGIPETKTSFGELDGNKRKVYWSDGDQIAVSGSASQALSGVAAKSTEAVFVFDKALSAPYDVLYPAGIWKDASTVTLPATQTYVVDGIADGSLPMAGYSADGIAATLRYLCAIVNVPVKQSNGNADKVTAVTIASIGNEYMSGDFTIDYQEATLKGQSGTASVSILPDVTLSSTPTNFYVVVPAATYATGIKVIVASENSGEMSKALSRSVALEAGHIYNLDAIEFSPEAGAEEVKVDISSAEDLIQLATAYNSGTYSDKALVVNMTSDVAFDATSSAAFSATGGIGSTDDGKGNSNYFHGTFNGNNKTIKGYTGSVPVFAYIGSSGVVKDFTLDSSCAFAFAGGSGYYGAVAGYHRGTISNVTMNGSISLAPAAAEQNTYVGGIAGRVVIGSISLCACNGDIILGSDYGVTDQVIYVGGIAGAITNASGSISQCTFNGIIDNQATITETTLDKANPCLFIGGIIGKNAGTVSKCAVENHATGVTVVLTDTSDHPYTGTIVTHTASAYFYVLGGIAGQNDAVIENNINNANIVNIFSTDAGRGTSDSNGRYFHVGGIVGTNTAEGSVSYCTNNATIVDRAFPKMHYVGGIVGRNMGSVASCDNASTATIGVGTAHKKPYGARMLYLGGVIGYNAAGSSVSNVHNEAALNISRIETATGIAVCIGGVIGKSEIAIDGTAGGGTITNSGAIAQSSGIGKCETPTEENDYGLFLGGIVGYAIESVCNVSNSGAVSYTCTNAGSETSAGGAHYVHVGGIAGKVKAASAANISACQNSANVSFVASATNKKSSYVVYDLNYLGGVVAYAQNASFSNCSNSGIVKGGDNSQNKNTANTFWVGGIVGYLTGASSIEGCALAGAGQANNDHWSNRDNGMDGEMSGGIAGQVVGEENVLINISDCLIESTATVIGRRGNIGGIVGSAKYANITSCKVPIDFTGSGFYYGGIAGWAYNSTISNCIYSGNSIKSSQFSDTRGAGGIVSQLRSATVIDGCSSSVSEITKDSGAAITPFGGIAAVSEENGQTTIKNCHYKSSMQICSDTNFTDGGGNAADL